MNFEQCKPSFGVSINYYASLNMQNLTLNYTCMAETQLSTTLHLTKRTSVWVCEMQGSKRVFRQAKTAEEEKQLLENAVPKSTRNSTTWVYRIFNEWQFARTNKDPRYKNCSLMFDLDKVHRLD